MHGHFQFSQFSSLEPVNIKTVKCGLKKECFKLLAERQQRR